MTREELVEALREEECGRHAQEYMKSEYRKSYERELRRRARERGFLYCSGYLREGGFTGPYLRRMPQKTA
jgi:hypothetical protein